MQFEMPEDPFLKNTTGMYKRKCYCWSEQSKEIKKYIMDPN